MTKPIRRVGVLGAGVMGSGIAAHLANAGIASLLLDIVPPDLAANDRSKPAARRRIAAAGRERVLASKPPLLFHRDAARLIAVGNLEDDLKDLAACDLIIEAIPEQLDLKRELYERIEGVLTPDTIIASNTSGLRIADLLQDRSDAFRRQFLVMHFFNPVRYMKLLELVTGPDTDVKVVARVQSFGENVLGKGVVFAKDTPNFIGNRIGTHAMLTAIHLMESSGLRPEDVDALTGVPLGHPKSATFRTGDIVGLDTFAHVADHCYEALPDDEDRATFRLPAYVRTMTERKLLGDKTKGGFYRKIPGGLETLDPATLTYRPHAVSDDVRALTQELARVGDAAQRLRQLAAAPGRAGDFARTFLYQTLAYAARRFGEIADAIPAIDAALRWGYNWELGPFQTWDALGFAITLDAMKNAGVALPASIQRMRDQGATGFYREDGAVYDLARGAYVPQEVDPRTITPIAARRSPAPVLKSEGAEAWDVGDGVLALTFRTKANSLDADVIRSLGEAAAEAETNFRTLLVFNQGEHFCVGANVALILRAASASDWDTIRTIVRNYQSATQRLKYASVPVVVAPYGMTLGGGLELCLGGDAVQAAAETYTGLVEVGVGVLPGGGGTMNLLWRSLAAIPEGVRVNAYDQVTQVFKNIAFAKVSSSAEEAKALGYFQARDGVSFDRARHFAEAKGMALGLAASGYHAPLPRAFRLPGESGMATLGMMIDTLEAGAYASAHDAKIARKIAEVLCGGRGGGARDVTEDEMLELEAEAFVSLCGEEKSRARMEHMLKTNQPLRN